MVKRNLQLRKTVLISIALVFIGLGVGVSIGYGASPTRTSIITRTQQDAITLTETVPTTITIVSLSGQTYTVFTVTKQTVLVVVYQPKCIATSGQISTTYVNTGFGQSTTTTYSYPTGITNSSAISFTTVTNSTLTFSNQTVGPSISC